MQHAGPARVAITIMFATLLTAVAVDAHAAVRRGVPAGLVQPVAPIEDVARIEMPAVDVAALRAEDAQRRQSNRPQPLRFATGLPVAISPETAGTWEVLADGSELWRVRIVSPGALSLNLELDRFRLPAGATLWLYDRAGTMVQGPYTRADRNAEGGLWTALVPGDEAVVEVEVPAGGRPALDLRVASVNHGYRDFGAALTGADTKSGSCNINVICPQGDDWRDQIRSVARIAISGVGLCTGQLLNNTAEDGTPYLLTAQHCVENASQATSVVAYWNYESPVCDMTGGGSLTQNQSGATLVSLWPWKTGSDFALIRLDRVPDTSFNVYYSGWDATGDIPTGSVGIHHPSGDEKAISINTDPLIRTNYYGYGTYQWEVTDWEQGTTEGGSSGSCIYDPVSHLCVGTLTAGTADCNDPYGPPAGYDIYGRMDAHWTGDGSSAGRLSDWLDPLGTGALTLAGIEPGDTPPATSFSFTPLNPTTGAPVSFTDTSTGSPASWSWDFGDGGTSSVQNPVHTFSSAGIFTVSLTATNPNGSTTASIDVTVSLDVTLDEAYFVAAAAFSSGLEGSFFQTDVDINNGGDATASYLFSWLPRGENNSSPTTSGVFTLAAGASARYENVLSEVFGLEPDVVGALAISANTTELTVMSRTYNVPGVKVTGTFGQAIPGVPSPELIGQNDVRRIVFMSENDDFRSNVGCVNGVNDTVSITIELYRDDGALLAVESMALPAFSNNQINQIFADYAPTNGYVDVSSAKAGAGFFCYGSVLDNGSSDPTTILPR